MKRFNLDLEPALVLCLDTFMISTISLYSIFWTPSTLYLFAFLTASRKLGSGLVSRTKGSLNVLLNSGIFVNYIGIPILAVFSIQIFRYIRGLKVSSDSKHGFPMKPMLFPCRTSHTRLIPTKRSFSYSYLLVGIPVGWKGSTGGMIAVDGLKEKTSWYRRLLSLSPASSWFNIDSDDHLGRGHAKSGLQAKLNVFLRSQGQDPQEYPHAYLFTAPRFLGYSFNPVSIWNLYSASKELQAVVLEVNNTSDERHSYFLKRDSSPEKEESMENLSRFSKTWPKDFHVSVFNSRKGTYSISASDPFFPSMAGPGNLNTTITLNSSTSQTKFVARVFSTASPMDPSVMTTYQKTRFLLSWWWVGLITFPRIVYQAVTILLKTPIKWVSRPEPRAKTMPRRANATEQYIESIFRKYLRSILTINNPAILIRYTAAGIDDVSTELMFSPSAMPVQNKALEREALGISPLDQPLHPNLQELEIRVLTPAFYSRFVQYRQSIDGFLSEHYENNTISISDPKSLALMKWYPHARMTRSTFKEGLWSDFFRHLKRRPKRIVNTESTQVKSDTELDFGWKRLTDERRSRYVSQIDSFVVAESETEEERMAWAKMMSWLVVAEMIAFGWVGLLELEFLIVRCAGAWLFARFIIQSSGLVWRVVVSLIGVGVGAFVLMGGLKGFRIIDLTAGGWNVIRITGLKSWMLLG